jgi:hypothetical protein
MCKLGLVLSRYILGAKTPQFVAPPQSAGQWYEEFSFIFSPFWCSLGPIRTEWGFLPRFTSEWGVSKWGFALWVRRPPRV